jgi:hypothetical protein
MAIVDVLIILAILFLAEFTIKGLFNTKWREQGQNRINGFKREKIFWYLIKNANSKIELTIRDIYNLYILYLDGVLNPFSFPNEKNSEPYNLDKNIIKKNKSSFSNIRFLGEKIVEREEIIIGLLEKNSVAIDAPEVQQKFEEFKKRHHKIKGAPIPEQYEKLTEHFVSLVKTSQSGKAIWDIRTKFDKEVNKYIKDYDKKNDDYKEIDLDFIITAKMEVDNIVKDLLCEKIQNTENRQKLAKSLTEWEQLKMLQWCLIDFDVLIHDGNPTNITVALWRLIARNA